MSLSEVEVRVSLGRNSANNSYNPNYTNVILNNNNYNSSSNNNNNNMRNNNNNNSNLNQSSNNFNTNMNNSNGEYGGSAVVAARYNRFEQDTRSIGSTPSKISKLTYSGNLLNK